MNCYYIKPSVPTGNAFKVIDDSKSYYSKPPGFFPMGSLILEIDSYDYHDQLFTIHPYFFVTQELKNLFESNTMFEVTFQEIDVFVLGHNLIDTQPTHGYSKNSFWLISYTENNDHFRLYDNKLIVSEKALDFLLVNEAFKLKIYGGVYGKGFEWVDNIFQIRESPEIYFSNHYQDDLLFVQQKEANMLEHYKSMKQ